MNDKYIFYNITSDKIILQKYLNIKPNAIKLISIPQQIYHIPSYNVTLDYYMSAVISAKYKNLNKTINEIGET
jgi:hypothetical protein